MLNPKKRSPPTLCVQGTHSQTAGPAVVPIVQTSTFVFENQQHMLDSVQGKSGNHVYTRWSNPTTKSVEEKISALEGTDDTHVVASGMAAISSAIMGLVKGGERILSSDSIYGGTVHLFNEILPQNGIHVDYVDTDEVADALLDSQEKYKLCFFETPTNPTLKIIDMKQVADAAIAVGTISMIDSTFGSPINQRPHEFGVDLVMHSATKYLGGHSDIIAGTISGSNELMARVRSAAKLLGGTMDPFASFLLDRGIKTLSVRMERHNANAIYLAEKLSQDSRIKQVHYPGLPSHPHHQVARRQMNGFGGMLSLDLDSDLAGTRQFVDSLDIFLNAVSLGGVESLASIPVLTTHYGLGEKILSEAGICDSTVRLSVGIEDATDLLKDLLAALDSLNT
ncbi:MAG: aminotransferase class I/II-fold pyridoxal phosphate-dependent enzyme [Candidatus Thorarchaeota archaeon]|nr:aminotransferase class I/II-fold pyridoxal phosphate-dependent enzyme [Candidatus Thorarchaeota archaeon]